MIKWLEPLERIIIRIIRLPQHISNVNPNKVATILRPSVLKSNHIITTRRCPRDLPSKLAFKMKVCQTNILKIQMLDFVRKTLYRILFHRNKTERKAQVTADVGYGVLVVNGFRKIHPAGQRAKIEMFSVKFQTTMQT